jgi:hypothetical protein
MDSDRIYELLEQKWSGLKEESGYRWHDIVEGYIEITDRLPDDASKDDVDEMLNEMKELLTPYHQGSALFNVIVAFVGDEPDNWSRKKLIPGKRNKLRDLGKKELEKPKDDKADQAREKGKSKGTDD